MPKILVVDDRPENVYMMQAILQGGGYAVESAGNGKEALAAAAAAPPDLVISDILMPVMDGFNLCRAWKNDPRFAAIPFLFYTATYTDDRDIEFALKQGADAFLAKPAEPETILAQVRQLLQARPRLAAAESAVLPDPVYLQEYNEVLVRKLVAKVEELEQRNRDLARKEKMKSHFLTIAAHELHTPLACIMGYAELLRQQVANPLVPGLCRGIDRLASVTRTILQMSKAEAEELPLQRRRLELTALVRERLEGLRAFIVHRQQALQEAYAPTPLMVAGDPDELGQAFDCLVLNAIRFTPDAGTITIATMSTPSGPAVRVTDTGIGIPADEHERIFEKFYQVRDAASHHSGTIEFLSGGLGLGLAIARAIAVRHGGTVTVRSSPGAGSTFTLQLPAAEGA